MMNIGDFTKPEDLHPDLQDWVEDDGLPALKHPLVFAVPYISALNSLYNQQYNAKLKSKEKALQSKNWSHYIWLTERPYRLEAFLEIENLINDEKEWWALVGDIWSDSENIWQNFDEWAAILSSDKENKEFIMNDKEKELLEKLPDEFIVYRGCLDHNKEGLSWTLKEEIAYWFANRFNKSGVVLERKVKKEQVLAYFTRRNEEEIVLKGCQNA